jgi:hypothetical protein
VLTRLKTGGPFRSAKDSLQRELPTSDEASARYHCLHKGMGAPDLITVKGFLRFYIATSRGKIVEKLTIDSVNTFAKWFFAGFSYITGKPTDKEDGSEVYKANALPLGTWQIQPHNY